MPIEKGKCIRPGKMIIFHDINNNILISHPYSSGVYRYEHKN